MDDFVLRLAFDTAANEIFIRTTEKSKVLWYSEKMKTMFLVLLARYVRSFAVMEISEFSTTFECDVERNF